MSYKLFFGWKKSYKTPRNWTETRLCVCMRLVRKYSSLPLSHTPAVWHLPGWVTPQAIHPGFAKSQLWNQSAPSWYQVYFPISANSQPVCFALKQNHIWSFCPDVPQFHPPASAGGDESEVNQGLKPACGLSLSKTCLKPALPVAMDSDLKFK